MSQSTRKPAGNLSLSLFSGEWVLTRTIQDHRNAKTLSMDGMASFTQDGSTWLYHETGQLSSPGMAPMKAERQYRFDEMPDGALVSFADGRPFHMFRWASPTATHLCDPDTYKVAYDFTWWPEWSAQWDVSGPNKDYRLLSHYRRT